VRLLERRFELQGPFGDSPIEGDQRVKRRLEHRVDVAGVRR
jgi:hypothetical protein